MSACSELEAALDDAALGMPPSRALATHLATCAACATLLERRRALAQRIDRTIGVAFRAEPPPWLAENIAARVAVQRPRRRSLVWLGVPAAAALAAAVFIVVATFGGLRGTSPAPDVAAIAAWQSPTASLLVSRSSVLGAPFTLRGVRDGVGRVRS